MKKLLLILSIAFFSSTSIAKTGDVYYCDELQHRTIFPERVGENNDTQKPIFKFKLEDENLIFYTKEEVVKDYNAPETILYPIIYQNFEFLDGNEEEVERFGAQNEIGTIIFVDDKYFEISVGDLTKGINQPFVNILRTATCKIY